GEGDHGDGAEPTVLHQETDGIAKVLHKAHVVSPSRRATHTDPQTKIGCAGFSYKQGVRPTYARATWLFLRLLGLTYLLAFWSLHAQILGLIGHAGILPAAEYVDRAREFFAANQAGVDRFRQLPTLCWLGAGDPFLRGLSLGGIVLAV